MDQIFVGLNRQDAAHRFPHGV